MTPHNPIAHPDQLAVRHYPQVPAYLQQAYWWAYVHPRAVHVFVRDATLAPDAHLDIVDVLPHQQPEATRRAGIPCGH